MLGKRLRHCKDAAARPQSGEAGTGGEDFVEPGKTGRRDRTVASPHAFQHHIELGCQAEPASDMAKLDNFDTHRERRHELRALQRLGRVR